MCLWRFWSFQRVPLPLNVKNLLLEMILLAASFYKYFTNFFLLYHNSIDQGTIQIVLYKLKKLSTKVLSTEWRTKSMTIFNIQWCYLIRHIMVIKRHKWFSSFEDINIVLWKCQSIISSATLQIYNAIVVLEWNGMGGYVLHMFPHTHFMRRIMWFLVGHIELNALLYFLLDIWNWSEFSSFFFCVMS